jgi:hypothetical protein
MSITEERLRDALENGAQTVQHDDLSPLVVPRKAPRRLPRWALIAVPAAAAVAFAAMQLWPTASDEAEASWSPVPRAVTGEEAAELGQHCVRHVRSISAEPREPATAVKNWRPTAVVDVRGRIAVVLLVGGPHYATCEYYGLGTSDGEIDGLNVQSMTGSWSIEPVEPVGDAVVTIEMISRSIGERSATAVGYGQAGPGVAKVVIELDDGTVLQSTTMNGWYVAWWPDRLRPPGGPGNVIEKNIASVRAYDASGELLRELRPDGVPDR